MKSYIVITLWSQNIDCSVQTRPGHGGGGISSLPQALVLEQDINIYVMLTCTSAWRVASCHDAETHMLRHGRQDSRQKWRRAFPCPELIVGDDLTGQSPPGAWALFQMSGSAQSHCVTTSD